MGVMKVRGSGTNVALLFAIASWPRLVDKTSDGTATGRESSLSLAGVDMKVLMLLC
jgi:hypothetical protein